MQNFLNILLLLAAMHSLPAQVAWHFTSDRVKTWNYEWGDEFNGISVDVGKWNYWYGWSRSIYGNKEQQYYTDGKNHIVSNGTLRLVARKEEVIARMVDWLRDTDTIRIGNRFYCLNKTRFNYTSGMIASKRTFLYGYFEMRFKAPKEKGMWPAFWLAGGDPNEEFDIFELKGEKENKIHIDTHCPAKCDYFKNWIGKRRSWGGWLKTDAKLSEGFNVASAIWEPDQVKFYFNGTFIGKAKVNFAVEKAIFANLAIPSNNGPFKPGPDASFTVSDSYEIDYIRAWTSAEREPASRRADTVQALLSPLPSQNGHVTQRIKMSYGRKEELEKEGIFVSLLPSLNRTFILYTMGNMQRMKVSVRLEDVNGNTVYTVDTDTFQTNLDFSKFASGGYKLVVRVLGQEARKKIEL